MFAGAEGVASRLRGSDSAPAGTIGPRFAPVLSALVVAVGATLPSAVNGAVAREVEGICELGKPLSGETSVCADVAEVAGGSALPVGAAGFAPGSAAVSATLRLGSAELMFGVANGVPVGDVLITVPGAVAETPLVAGAVPGVPVTPPVPVLLVPRAPLVLLALALVLVPAAAPLVPAPAPAPAPPAPPAPLWPNKPATPAPAHQPARMIRNFVFMAV